MKKTIIYGGLMIAILTLAACGRGNVTSGTGSAGQQTSGSSAIPEDEGVSAAGIPVTGLLVPKHCADLGYKYVPKKIGNSYQSYLDCEAYDPASPAQNSTLVKP